MRLITVKEQLARLVERLEELLPMEESIYPELTKGFIEGSMPLVVGLAESLQAAVGLLELDLKISHERMMEEGGEEPSAAHERAGSARAQGDSATSTKVIDKAVARVSGQLNLPIVDLNAIELEPSVVWIVPKEIAVKHRLIAFERVREGVGLLKVAMADPTNIFAADDVKYVTGYPLQIHFANEVAIASAIAKYYPRPDPERA